MIKGLEDKIKAACNLYFRYGISIGESIKAIKGVDPEVAAGLIYKKVDQDHDPHFMILKRNRDNKKDEFIDSFYMISTKAYKKLKRIKNELQALYIIGDPTAAGRLEAEIYDEMQILICLLEKVKDDTGTNLNSGLQLHNKRMIDQGWIPSGLYLINRIDGGNGRQIHK